MNAIDAYLNEMSWAMGGSFAEQQAVRDEVRGDILDQVRDLQLEGVDEDAAVARALRELGAPSELGRELRRSRGTAALRRPLMQPHGALVLERRSAHSLPPVRLFLALAAVALLAAVMSLVYVWP